MTPEALRVFQQCQSSHRELIALLVELEKSVKICGDVKELSDTAYALRESLKFAKHQKVEVEKLGKLVAQLTTLLWSQMPTVLREIETDWCKCSPDPQPRASVPKPDRDWDRYKKVMESVGVPKELIETQMMRIDWDLFGEYLAQRKAEGHGLPDGIDPGRTYTEYRLHIRKRRDLNEVQPSELETVDKEDARRLLDEEELDDGRGIDSDDPF